VAVLQSQLGIDDAHASPKGTALTLEHHKPGHRVITPLIGKYQARNTATAIATLAAMGEQYLPAPSEISRALEAVFLPGRFQRAGKFIFDVAHNPAGARAVAETIASLDPPRPRTALIAVLADK